MEEDFLNDQIPLQLNFGQFWDNVNKKLTEITGGGVASCTNYGCNC